MFFNSLDFLVFLPVVFAAYWLLRPKGLFWQNLLLLVASYVFYSFWDWRFLFLLVFSTTLDYVSGLRIERSASNVTRKAWFWTSISINLGFLGVFKYYNFFIASFGDMLAEFGLETNPVLLRIVLPVGISFYTFHGLSYVIDIYKRRITAEKNVVTYSLFVSYFPLLVAGPIERATHLLPQLKRERRFDSGKAIDGLQQIVWGLVKKIVIADNCATYANDIFDHAASMNSLTLVIGAIYFAFQIYGDFSGYSDIALGTSKLFGIDLLRNFNYPYFSRDIAEFWRRWHISLSSWFRDYLYIPLGGSSGGIWMKIRNTFIIFLVSGFWHGANWTFLAWGFLNALYFLPLLVRGSNRRHMDIVANDRNWPTAREFFSMLATFALTTMAWIFFRAKSLSLAFSYLRGIFSLDFKEPVQYLNIERYSIELLGMLGLFVVVEWLCRRREHPFFGKMAFVKLILAIVALLLFGVYSNAKNFIYFQF
jgi:D-alanyl-lipoteichoic acid acyltransferase DltB (MBOAT superfamily)